MIATSIGETRNPSASAVSAAAPDATVASAGETTPEAIGRWRFTGW
jgi:hypothetical protein